jgi:hypothetical protein
MPAFNALLAMSFVRAISDGGDRRLENLYAFG